LAGSPNVGSNSGFKDVKAGEWYAKAVAWASKNGIVSGVGNGNFAPNMSVDRAQFATMLCNYARYTGVQIPPTNSLGSFADEYAVPSWAEQAMSWAVSQGIISGIPKGNLLYVSPGGVASRAQAASMLMRYRNASFVTEIIVATYNIKRFFDGTTPDMICAEIIASGASIVGVQEVSNGQAEIGKIDQTLFMAKKCGFKYYSFCPTAYNDQYGSCILSKYPIKSTENISYAAQAGEHRKYSRTVLDVDGTEVILYNTHLAIGGQDSVTGPKQFEEVLAEVYKDMKTTPTILTGDFNLYMSDQKKYVDTNRLIPMNGGESMTFPVYSNNTTLDNIYVSKAHWAPTWYDEIYGGYVKCIVSEASDHDIIYGAIRLK
jgi:endonuclease/exonuclease/phosphatase family metal-dependent hydrolase